MVVRVGSGGSPAERRRPVVAASESGGPSVGRGAVEGLITEEMLQSGVEAEVTAPAQKGFWQVGSAVADGFPAKHGALKTEEDLPVEFVFVVKASELTDVQAEAFCCCKMMESGKVRGLNPSDTMLKCMKGMKDIYY